VPYYPLRAPTSMTPYRWVHIWKKFHQGSICEKSFLKGLK
jgi:hypothetical protein